MRKRDAFSVALLVDILAFYVSNSLPLAILYGLSIYFACIAFFPSKSKNGGIRA